MGKIQFTKQDFSAIGTPSSAQAYLGYDLDGTITFKTNTGTPSALVTDKILASFSSQSFITIPTLADAMTLATTEGIVQGQSYLIESADVLTYEYPVAVLVEGLSPTQFSTKGYGRFYNPKYWDESLGFGPTYIGVFSTFSFNYTNGMLAIYGGRLWECTVAAVSMSPSGLLELDALEWNVINTFTDTYYYTSVIDEIEIDYNIGLIVSRYDSTSSIKVQSNFKNIQWTSNDYTPVQAFQWGNGWNTLTNTGIANCDIQNSYLECLNWECSLIRNVHMSGLSYVINGSVLNNTSIVSLSLHEGSHITNFELIGTEINNLSFREDSGGDSFSMIDSTIMRVSFNKNSGFGAGYFLNFYFADSSFNNDSGFGMVSAMTSSFMLFDFTNWAGFGGCEIMSTTWKYLDFTNAGFDSINTQDSYITNLSFHNANLYNTFMYGLKYSNIQFSGVFINGQGSILTGYESGTIYHNTDISVNFSIVFDGSTASGLSGSQVYGYGENSIPPIIFPPGYYVDKFTVYSTDLVDDNGGLAAISSGLDAPEFFATISDFNYAGGLIESSLNSGPPTSVSRLRTMGGEPILMFLDGGNITSGRIDINMVCRNLGASYNDDSYNP